jgi:fructoselysine-6-P-deglycase FrlB-like protein
MRKVAGKAGAAAAAKVSTLLTRITSALPSMRRSERDAAEFAQDVVLAFSASGRTLDLIENVRTATESGASVIAVTTSNTPLAAAATLALHADVHEDTDVYTPMTASLKCACSLLNTVRMSRRQKPRFLPPATKLMSEKAPQATFSGWLIASRDV